MFELIIVVVLLRVRAVKIYVAAVEALRKRARQNETHFCEFSTAINANVLFL